MWFVLLLIVAAATGAIGYNLGQRQQPAVRATVEADAVVVAFLRVVNQRMDVNTAQAVRGVAWETYVGSTGEYMRGQLAAQPLPPVGI